MFNIRNFISTIMLILLCITVLFSSPVSAKDNPPVIKGKYGVAIDAKTGEILYDKNADKQAYPASITKVMTAIILDEKAKDNQMLTVSSNAAGQECICFGLQEGEQISKKNAMYGMLLLSANDLAVTVAENIGGSVQGFAQLMNEEAKKLGLKHTHFVTPNGLHDPDHYTTPHDMALIMKEALNHPEVLNALSTQSALVHTSLGDKYVTNTSQVHTQPASAHVIAGKNGYTDQAGHTLVEYLKDGDKEIIAVVMKTNKKYEYKDIQTMANYAFAHMITKKIASKGEVVKKTQVNGETVGLIAEDDITVTLKSSDISKLSTKIDWLRTKGKAIKKGQEVADFKVMLNGRILKETSLRTNKAIQKTETPSKTNVFLKVAMYLMVIGFTFVIFVRITIVKYKKAKYKKAKYRKTRRKMVSH